MVPGSGEGGACRVMNGWRDVHGLTACRVARANRGRGGGCMGLPCVRQELPSLVDM